MDNQNSSSFYLNSPLTIYSQTFQMHPINQENPTYISNPYYQEQTIYQAQPIYQASPIFQDSPKYQTFSENQSNINLQSINYNLTNQNQTYESIWQTLNEK